MNDRQLTNFISGLCILLLLIVLVHSCIEVASAQEVTTRYIAPESNTQPGFEYEVSWNWDDYNIWTSHASFNHIMVTQSVGDVQVNGVGFGVDPELREGLRFFLDIGVGFSSTDFRQRVLEEAIYYEFKDPFGHPPFIKNKGNFHELTHINEVDEYAPLGRIGISYSPGSGFSVGGGYFYHQLENYISMENPDLNGGFDRNNPDACACKWEGVEKIDLSGWMMEVKWRF